jgi:phosphatidate cytidylyltransferase
VLAQRLAVAAVGLPLLAALLYVPERIFAAVVTTLIAAATIEFIRASQSQSAPDEEPSWATAIAAGVLAALLAVTLRTVIEVPVWSPAALLGVTVLALLLVLWPALGEPTAGSWMLAGVMYVGVLGAHLLLLRTLPDGQGWLVVLLGATFATDTGAYTAGRMWGSHLLAPMISPSKTWEGFAGGVAAGAAATIALVVLLGIRPGGPWLGILAFGLPLAAIGGDLLESALKRRMEVKDMSTLLPGHGGLLDRLDSVLAVGPLLYWVLWWAIPSSG